MPVPYRIKIGVTGHRKDLPPVDLLKEKIRSVLGYREWNETGNIKPDSVFSLLTADTLTHLKNIKNTPVALSILTALAEGADRIVAQTVLETAGSMAEVVLPLSEDDYLQDFKTEASKKEFKKLMQSDPYPVRLRNRNLQDQYDLALLRFFYEKMPGLHSLAVIYDCSKHPIKLLINLLQEYYFKVKCSFSGDFYRTLHIFIMRLEKKNKLENSFINFIHCSTNWRS